jgi:DNA-binding NarL/FixJ family response regulator
MNPLRLILVDDHNLVRAGLRSLLAELPHVTILAEADNGFEALRLVHELKPDVLVTDIAMPGLNGLELTERLKEECPQVRVLLLSMHASEEYVLRAMQLGAAGYLLKDAGTNELELALNAISHGEAYLSPAISRRVIDGYVKRVSKEPTNGNHTAENEKNITPRQREVLKLIAEGCTTKEIAQRLELSAKTVDAHRTQLMKQLDIHDIASLVRYAIRIGLVSAE